METTHTTLWSLSRAAALTCAVIAVLSVGTGSSWAADNDGSPVSVDEAVSFRGDFGLRDDRSYVAQSFDDPGFSSDAWGIPLSADELADLDHRIAIQRAIFDAIDWAADQPESAGMYLDQHKEGRPVFLFTSDIQDLRRNLRDRIPDWVDFDVEEATHSLAELTSTRDSIVEDWDRLAQSGTLIDEASVDVSRNRVVIGVTERHDGDDDVLGSYGSGVVVHQRDMPVLDDCSGGINNCRPIKGGIHITSWGDCTAGYMGRRTDGSHKDLGIITAGHCVWEDKEHSHSHTWTHNASGFGVSGDTTHAFQTGSDGDVGWIKADMDEVGSTGLNRFLATPGGTVANLTGTMSWVNQVVTS